MEADPHAGYGWIITDNTVRDTPLLKTILRMVFLEGVVINVRTATLGKLLGVIVEHVVGFPECLNTVLNWTFLKPLPGNVPEINIHSLVHLLIDLLMHCWFLYGCVLISVSVYWFMWLFVDLHGCLLISMAVCLFVWPFVDFCGCWLFVDLHGCLLISMAVYLFVWLFVDFCGCWLFVDFHGCWFLQLFVDFWGCLLISMAVC